MSLLKIEPNLVDSLGSFTFSNVNATGNVTASYVIGNGSQLTGLPASYANSNVAAYLPTYTGNVNANYFIGNGSLLTGLSASYANTNVAAYLPTYSGVLGGTLSTNAQPNITSVGSLASLTVTGLTTATGGVKTANIQDATGTVTIQTKHNSQAGDVGIVGNLVVGTGGTGNVTATYFIGDGSQLTGISGGGGTNYTNSNVANYLPTYTGVMTFAVANLHVTGGTTGQYLQTDGTGNLTWATVTGGGGGGGTYVTRSYVADGSANTYTVTSGCGVDNVLVFINGVCQAPTDDYTISSTTLTLVSFTPVLGTKVQIRELPR